MLAHNTVERLYEKHMKKRHIGQQRTPLPKNEDKQLYNTYIHIYIIKCIHYTVDMYMKCVLSKKAAVKVACI